METNAERRRRKLTDLCKVRGLKDVAARAELNPDSLAQIIKGVLLPAKKDGTRSPRNLGDDAARKIEDAEGLGLGWFDDASDEEPTSDIPTDDDFAMVPQLDISAACGSGRWEDHVVVKGGLAFKRSSLRDFGVPESAARIIYASGGSMEPTISDGCVVLLNTSDTSPREGRVYAICQPDGSLVLKRLVMDYIPSLAAQGWVMRSDNADKHKHPDKILPPDNRTMIVGRAVWNDNRL